MAGYRYFLKKTAQSFNATQKFGNQAWKQLKPCVGLDLFVFSGSASSAYKEQKIMNTVIFFSKFELNF